MSSHPMAASKECNNLPTILTGLLLITLQRHCLGYLGQYILHFPLYCSIACRHIGKIQECHINCLAMGLKGGVQQVAIEAIGLASASAQEHTPHGSANFALGN